MPRMDLPQHELETYLPDRTEPADFEEFWAMTLRRSRAAAEPPRFSEIDAGLPVFDTWDVSFSGFDGQPVAAWLVVPTGRTGPLPCVVQYLGYGGGRGFAFERLTWAAAGYAQLVMDNRGQGASLGSAGATADVSSSAGPHAVGYSTRGILEPEEFYFRRLYTDGVLAVDAVRAHPAVDGDRVVVAGGSLGGGTALAVAALAENLAGALVDVPALCHPRRAMEVVEGNTYREIWTFLRTNRDKADQVFRTLSYVDGMNFAVRATTPALFSVALMDDIVPSSSVYAAYNHYAGAKDIRVWPFNRHEAGGPYQTAEQIAYVRDLLS
ncbi:acetylxylan esterase [Georgenia halophila]|uniref:Acetylxylan esterase n=1 Tax=Georgenia halophila TaxID=620889 RepID=A0ABP8LJ43_9MICO